VLGGADCIQLREKEIDARELLERARALVEMVRGLGGTGFHRAAIIINDRPDIALLSGADGVHLGQTDMSVRDARRIVGMEMLIGVSTERIEQARAALADGADYLGVGPMFSTTTKDKPRIAGPAYLREVVSHQPELPACLAIGGINAERVAELRANAPGFGERWGVAVSSAVCGAKEPEGVCRALVGNGPVT
jgi:thiamine-phosphate pyrophosphorylase